MTVESVSLNMHLGSRCHRVCLQYVVSNDLIRYPGYDVLQTVPCGVEWNQE